MDKKPTRRARKTDLPPNFAGLPRVAFTIKTGASPSGADSLHAVHEIQSLDTLINEYEKREPELKARMAEGSE